MTGYANNGNSLDFAINSKLKWSKHTKYSDYFIESRADHELFFNDPGYLSPSYKYKFNKGYNSVFRRCSYGHDNNYHLLKYGEKFFDAYKKEKKVMYFDF